MFLLYSMFLGGFVLFILLIVVVRVWMRARAERRLREAVQNLYTALDTVYGFSSQRLDLVQTYINQWVMERTRHMHDSLPPQRER